MSVGPGSPAAAQVEPPQLQRVRDLEGPLKLLTVRAAIDLLVPVGAPGGLELTHQVDVRVGTELVGNEVQDRLGFVDQAGITRCRTIAERSRCGSSPRTKQD
jgi:hypothetical protein